MTPEEIESLPPELVSQLSRRFLAGSTSGEDARVIELVNKGASNADLVMIAYYKAHGEVLKRHGIVMRLSRLAKAGKITGLGNGNYAPASSRA